MWSTAYLHGGHKGEIATQHVRFDVPIRVAYGVGALSISIRINAGDSSTVVNCGWQGFTDLSL